mmetsp:Transcript_38877/g.121470  ORF Transcript_38877/g.121470 Transcript_38877/m.121470 type:complete len:432 (-) Transcript_38877:9-1304(-)
MEWLLVVYVVLQHLQAGLRGLRGDLVLQSQVGPVLVPLDGVPQVVGQLDVYLQKRVLGLRGLELLEVLRHLRGSLGVVLLGVGLLYRPGLLLQQGAQSVYVQVPDLAIEGILGGQAELGVLLFGPLHGTEVRLVVADAVHHVDERLIRELRAQHRKEVYPAVQDYHLADAGPLGRGDLRALLPLRAGRHRRHALLRGLLDGRLLSGGLAHGLLLAEPQHDVHHGLASTAYGVYGGRHSKLGLQVHQRLGYVEGAGGIPLDVEVLEEAWRLHGEDVPVEGEEVQAALYYAHVGPHVGSPQALGALLRLAGREDDDVEAVLALPLVVEDLLGYPVHELQPAASHQEYHLGAVCLDTLLGQLVPLLHAVVLQVRWLDDHVQWSEDGAVQQQDLAARDLVKQIQQPGPDICPHPLHQLRRDVRHGGAPHAAGAWG